LGIRSIFLYLGTVGFGGPAALVGFMHRDLVEQRGWITEDTYKLALALAQIMPGPLAAQVAIANRLTEPLPWASRLFCHRF
jgi:chromate transporter